MVFWREAGREVGWVLCHGWREDPSVEGEGWLFGAWTHGRGGFSSEALGW